MARTDLGPGDYVSSSYRGGSQSQYDEYPEARSTRSRSGSRSSSRSAPKPQRGSQAKYENDGDPRVVIIRSGDKAPSGQPIINNNNNVVPPVVTQPVITNIINGMPAYPPPQAGYPPAGYPQYPPQYPSQQAPQGYPQGGYYDQNGYWRYDAAMAQRAYSQHAKQPSYPQPPYGHSVDDLPIRRLDRPNQVNGAPGTTPATPKDGSIARTAARILSWGAIAVGAFWTGIAGLGLLTGGAPIGGGIAPPPYGNWSNFSQAWPGLLFGVGSMSAGAWGLKATKPKPSTTAAR